MNPSSPAEFGSPAPAVAPAEQLPTYSLPEAQLGRPEGSVLPEAGHQPSPAAAALAQANASQTGGSQTGSVSSSASSVVDNTADDGDLIEKEWVLRAKQVIQEHMNDPYEQAKQLNVVKADYMKKRYNKTVKLT
jgi:hypothetical protein